MVLSDDTHFTCETSRGREVESSENSQAQMNFYNQLTFTKSMAMKKAKKAVKKAAKKAVKKVAKKAVKKTVKKAAKKTAKRK